MWKAAKEIGKETEEVVADKAQEIKERTKGVVTHVKERSEEAVVTARVAERELEQFLKGKAGDVSQQSRNLGRSIKTRVGDVWEDVKEKTKEAGEAVQDKSYELADKTKEIIDVLKEKTVEMGER